MTRGKRIKISILFVLLTAALTGSLMADETKTIVGVVTQDGLIVDKSGTIYEIGENDNFDAVAEHIDVKIEVKGMVAEDVGGNKVIMVESFKVLEK